MTEVSMAKLFSTEMANHVAYEAVQMHGGLGYMRELPVERFARDYRLWTIAAGSSEMMREIICQAAAWLEMMRQFWIPSF